MTIKKVLILNLLTITCLSTTTSIFCKPLTKQFDKKLHLVKTYSNEGCKIFRHKKITAHLSYPLTQATENSKVSYKPSRNGFSYIHFYANPGIPAVKLKLSQQGYSNRYAFAWYGSKPFMLKKNHIVMVKTIFMDICRVKKYQFQKQIGIIFSFKNKKGEAVNCTFATKNWKSPTDTCKNPKNL